MFEKPIEEGFALANSNLEDETAEKNLRSFDIAPFVTVSMGDDLDQYLVCLLGA